MKPTGKFNPITGEEFLKTEEQDIDFWEMEWEELSDEQKVMFLSFIEAPYLSSKGEFKNDEIIKRHYNYWRFTNKYNPQLNIYGNEKND